MKLNLIELTKDNVPKQRVIVTNDEGDATVGNVNVCYENNEPVFYCHLERCTHFAYIPNLSQEIETVNPNQSLIDEYRGMIRTNDEVMKVLELDGKDPAMAFIANLTTHNAIYQQFITKLEGLL